MICVKRFSFSVAAEAKVESSSDASKQDSPSDCGSKYAVEGPSRDMSGSSYLLFLLLSPFVFVGREVGFVCRQASQSGGWWWDLPPFLGTTGNIKAWEWDGSKNISMHHIARQHCGMEYMKKGRYKMTKKNLRVWNCFSRSRTTRKYRGANK